MSVSGVKEKLEIPKILFLCKYLQYSLLVLYFNSHIPLDRPLMSYCRRTWMCICSDLIVKFLLIGQTKRVKVKSNMDTGVMKKKIFVKKKNG